MRHGDEKYANSESNRPVHRVGSLDRDGGIGSWDGATCCKPLPRNRMVAPPGCRPAAAGRALGGRIGWSTAAAFTCGLRSDRPSVRSFCCFLRFLYGGDAADALGGVDTLLLLCSSADAEDDIATLPAGTAVLAMLLLQLPGRFPLLATVFLSFARLSSFSLPAEAPLRIGEAPNIFLCVCVCRKKVF